MLGVLAGGRDVTVAHAGGQTVVTVRPGENLMQAARLAGLPLAGDCEGSMACATCHVIVDADHAGALPPASDDEEGVLDALFDVTATSRLACQLRADAIPDGFRVRVPSRS